MPNDGELLNSPGPLSCSRTEVSKVRKSVTVHVEYAQKKFEEAFRHFLIQFLRVERTTRRIRTEIVYKSKIDADRHKLVYVRLDDLLFPFE